MEAHLSIAASAVCDTDVDLPPVGRVVLLNLTESHCFSLCARAVLTSAAAEVDD